MAVDTINTVALLHGDGADTSTTFIDESGKIWTAGGNAQIDTAQSKFGGASILFDGTGDLISTDDSDDWLLDGGSDANQWTVDFWIRFNGDPGTGTQGIVQQYQDTSNNWNIALSNNNLNIGIRTGGVTTVSINNAWNPASATWYHVAVVKNGTTGYMVFVDGTQIGTTQTDTDTMSNINGTMRLGIYTNASGTNFYFNGWLDEIRFSKGVARWTSNFTPPTSAYSDSLVPDDSYSKSLIHFNMPDGHQTLIDEVGKLWTFNGNAQIDIAQSVFGGSSILFDGTGDYISTVDHVDFDLAATEWTIDARMRFNSLPNNTFNAGGARSLLGQFGAAGNRGYAVGLELTGGVYKLYFGYTTNGTTIVVLNSSTLTVSTNTWYHFAWVRDNSGSDVIRFFQDGVGVGTAGIDAVTIYNSTASMYIGTYDGTNSMMNGWVDELRISNGIARWTSNFTPPASEYEPLLGYDKFFMLF